MRHINRHILRIAITAGVLTVGLVTTACEPGDSAASSSTSAGTPRGASGDGGTRTLTGVLKYLAPGRLTVTPPGGDETAFWLAQDTMILGGGQICGEDSQSTYDCTEEEAEAAAKRGDVTVDVTMKGGYASRVAEHKAGEGGGTDSSSGGPTTGSSSSGGSASGGASSGGTGSGGASSGGSGGDGSPTPSHTGPAGPTVVELSGSLSYVAPGKFLVTSGGESTAFMVAQDTMILGGGGICGEDSQTTYDCTEEQLEAAAKRADVNVQVTLTQGIADKVAEVKSS
ncbi:hypothetical protein [Streptomyces sp. JHA26]|uniref:hypothetical protein n=1 Tax=Streptomyces sp. JHA26 TaxID=1917143 RepID=UPI00098A25AA|nr:hypothetical protein [Streptomyces sp. JHA26]